MDAKGSLTGAGARTLFALGSIGFDTVSNSSPTELRQCGIDTNRVGSAYRDDQ